jgi:hypothetical protein
MALAAQISAPRPESAPGPVPALPSAPAGDVSLGAYYTISTRDVVPGLSSASATAHRAFDRRFTSESFVAIVCSGSVLPRLEAMQALRGSGRAGMLTLKDFGPVDWSDGKQRLAVIYNTPGGGRFVLSTAHHAFQVIDALLRPAAAALAEIHNHGTTHRGIRPDNLFLRDASSAILTLGPSVAAPPGFDQPEIYEPLETAMAEPAARGAGGPRHDLFALGMTAVAMLLGRQPGAEFDRDELMIRRIEMGSLAAVMPPYSIPREIMDALTGLLADDETERWTLADLQKWLNAGRPEQPRLPDPVRITTPYSVGSKQVRTARSLAYMLGRNWTDAARHLRDNSISLWLRDYAPERTAGPRLDQALTEREPDAEAADADALQVCRAIMALDPEGPIRFRGAAVDPSGLGSWLYDAALSPDRRPVAAGVLRYMLAPKALDRRILGRRPDRRRATRQAINYERLRRWAISEQPGEGLERCLYDLNLNVPCLSPMTAGRWVASVPELIKSLDDAASSGRVKEPTLDSHIAAYIAARFDASGDALLTLIKPKDADDDARLGAIRLFAELQQAFGGLPLPGIAQWCATLARQVAANYRYAPIRQRMNEVIDRAVPSGNIAAIVKTVDVPGLRLRDERGFAAAKGEWVRLQLETASIERNGDMRRERARLRGRENAAFAAGAGSLLAMFATLFLDSAK